jgi:hypothetical protein
MRVNRRFIYAGVFLIALGAVLVATDLGSVATATLRGALRLWPLGLMAIGAALVLRRSPLALPSGMLAAAVPGLLLGGVFAVAPRYGYDCGADGKMSPTATQTGSLTAPASVSIRTGCGTLTIGTQAGTGWILSVANSAGYAPTVATTDSTLAVRTIGADDFHFFRGGRDEWQLTLPTDALGDLNLNLKATRTRISLPGASLGGLAVRSDLSDVTIDASQAGVSNLFVDANLASVTIRLSGLADLDGTIRADASSVRICAPPDLGLRVTSRVSAGDITVDGLKQSRGVWSSNGYETATHHADIDVNASLASVEINPIGGCS